jgi:signal transduction histidine kinase
VTAEYAGELASRLRLEARLAAFSSLAAAMTVDQPLEMTLREVVAAVRATTDAVSCSVLAWADPEAHHPDAYVDDAFGAGYGDALVASWSVRSELPASELPRLVVKRGFRAAVLEVGEFAALRPYWETGSWDDVVLVPLVAAGRAFGELHVHLPTGGRLAPADETFLVALADQAAVAALNATLFTAAAQTAAVLERQRLARDLHDSVSQALFSMTLHARAAQRHLAAAGVTETEPAAVEVARLHELTQGALAEMRALIFELRPGALAEEGLAAALTKQAAALTAREQVPVVVHAPDNPVDLPPEVAEHLYRLTLEALHNALKHAQASQLDVTVRVEDHHLLVAVDDDGVGFDPSQPHPGHLGLHTMSDRARAIGAELRVKSHIGAGTRITVRVPLPLPTAPAST